MSAYSMSKSSKEPSFISKNQNPGVGAYQTNTWNKVSRIKSSPSNSIPKTKKFFDPLQKSEIFAGPGSYNPEKPQTKLFASMKARRQVSYKTEAPSPANYNIQHNFSSKKYSFGRSNRKFKTQEGPGPGSDTLELKKDGTGCSFGKEERRKIQNEKLPGPGAYETEKKQLLKGVQEYTFPKQKKFITEQLEISKRGKIPGPGTYNISKFKQIFRGGKFTYGERMKILDKSEGPGPGFYQTQDATEKKNPRAVIGSEKRQFYVKSTTPGPGAYNSTKSQLIKRKDGTAVFPHGPRLRTEFSQTPGPGSYQSKPVKDSRAHSISSRPKQQKKETIPSPQDYQPSFKTIQKNEGQAIFGSESRLCKQKKEVPGPGSYQTQTKEHSKSFFFNKSTSKQKLNSTVGPGQYKIKPHIGMYDGIHKDNKDILYV